MDVNKIILDASVAVKWLLQDEHGSNVALQIRDKCLANELEIFVPTHFYSEVSNILARNYPKLYLPFLNQLFEYGLKECYLTLEIAGICSKLIKKYPKISFYDAFYHALAITRGGLFITADVKYYDVTKKEGNILFLGGLSMFK